MMIYVCVYVYMYACMYICMYVCLYVCMYICIYIYHCHLSVSRNHRTAPVVQRLLWLWRPIREWQSLPHLEHEKAVVGLLGRQTVFLQRLFSSAFTCCLSSYCDSPSFTVCLQASPSVAVTSQESVFMPRAWRSRLHTFLKRSWGGPVGLFPVASSPYTRFFGMRPSSVRVTCPSHRTHLCFKRVHKLGIPAFSSTALFVNLSSHVIPRIRLRQRMWNTFNRLSWCARIVQDSLL